MRGFLVSNGAAHLSVYRNSVVRAAIEVLGHNYPAVRFLSGEPNFAAMARAYWRAHPPRDGVMALYGAGFADFIEAAPPPGMPAILPDLARLDRAWLEAHHAEDAPVLTPGDLASLPPEHLTRRCFALHPSARLLRHRRALHASWAAARFEGRVIGAGRAAGEAVLVWRPGMEVRHRALAPDEARLIGRLADAAPLTEAADQSGAAIESFIRLLKEGVFARERT